MKQLFFIAILVGSAGFSALAQSEPVYDSVLAQKLGADEFGMKKYVLVILKTGAVTYNDQAQVDLLFRGHMENMEVMVDSGVLVVAGPLGKNEQKYRGIFILNVASIEEANKWILTDPAVKAKLLAADLYPWYGSAALPAYLDTHKVIQKTKL